MSTLYRVTTHVLAAVLYFNRAEAALPRGDTLEITADDLKPYPYVPRSPATTGASPNPPIPEKYREKYVASSAKERFPNCLSIGAIWNQGACGFGHAAAAMGMFTDRMCMATNGVTNKYYSLSQAVACTYLFDKTSLCDTHGGRVHDVLSMVVKKGIATGGRFVDDPNGAYCLPYQIPMATNPKVNDPFSAWPSISQLTCEKKCIANPGTAALDITKETAFAHLVWIKARTPDMTLQHMVEFMKDEIFHEGSVVATITIPDDFKQWDFSKGPYYGDDTLKGATGPIAGEQHSVRIIGWNTRPDQGNYQYWVVANSWGTGYHRDGFAFIRAGANVLHIEQIVTGVRIRTDNTAGGM